MGPVPINYGSLSVMFGAGLLMLWLLVAGYTIRDLSARVIFCLIGHFRARPDPWLESTLRKAFAEFDRELAVILHDRGIPIRATGPTRPARPRDPDSPIPRQDSRKGPSRRLSTEHRRSAYHVRSLQRQASAHLPPMPVSNGGGASWAGRRGRWRLPSARGWRGVRPPGSQRALCSRATTSLAASSLILCAHSRSHGFSRGLVCR